MNRLVRSLAQQGVRRQWAPVRSFSTGLNGESETAPPSARDYEVARQALELLGGSFDANPATLRKNQQKRSLLENNPALKRHELDTGSSEAQISVMTGKMNYLQEHLAKHPKDLHCRRGFLMLIDKRRKMLKYLKRKNPEKYLTVINELGIRDRKAQAEAAAAKMDELIE